MSVLGNTSSVPSFWSISLASLRLLIECSIAIERRSATRQSQILLPLPLATASTQPLLALAREAEDVTPISGIQVAGAGSQRSSPQQRHQRELIELNTCDMS
jgi:hypothetical protein